MKLNLIYLSFALVGSTSLVFALQSCDKHRAKNLSGTYDCQVHYKYWDMAPTQFDTTYNEKLEVVQDGKFVSVLNHRIHVDSLRDGKQYYSGYVHSYIRVQFKNDNLYVTTSSGGLGGNATYTYLGKK